MNLTTDSYDVLGNFLPEEQLQVVSTFGCNFGPDELSPHHFVLGLWVQETDQRVSPRYLTRAQRKKLCPPPPTTQPELADSDLVDLELGPHAQAIQESIVKCWQWPKSARPFGLLALSWAYRDSGRTHAAREVDFLYELTQSDILS